MAPSWFYSNRLEERIDNLQLEVVGSQDLFLLNHACFCFVKAERRGEKSLLVFGSACLVPLSELLLISCVPCSPSLLYSSS